MKIVIALLLSLALSAQAATTYYVRPDGNNSNTGTGNTAGTAFLTVKKALDTATSGDTVNITPGDYPQFASYNVATGNSMTINGTNAIMSGEGLFITGSNCVVNSLVFSNITDNFKLGAAITIGTNGHGTIVKNCLFKDGSDKHGIWTLLADNQVPPVISHWNMSANGCLFTNNVFSNIFGGQCFFVAGSNNLVIGNQFYQIRSGDLFIYHGVSNTFTKNICWSGDNPAGGLHPDIMQTYGTDGNADAPFAPTWGNKFTQNQFWDWRGALAQITVDDPLTNPVTPLRVDGPIVYNNLYVRCGPTNGSISSIDNPNTQFLNNTFINCGTYPDSSGHVLNFVLYATNILSPSWRGQATNCLVKNNAFIGCGRSTSDGWWNVEYNSVSSNATDVVGDYNYVVNWNGSAFAAKSGFVESHGVNPGTDPILVSYPSNNFRPMSTSALINVGTNVSAYVTTDFEGLSRSFGSATDIGAYEFDSNLRVHYDFDETFSTRILDTTGYAHHGENFSGTNWITSGTGVSGNAGVWQIVGTNGSGFLFSQYAAITNISNIAFITNGTIATWVLWASNATFGSVGRGATILDGGDPPSSASPSNYLATNSWAFGVYGKTFSENDTPGDAQFATPTGPVFKNWGDTLSNDLNTPTNMVLWQSFNGQSQLRDNVTWYHIAVTWIGGTNVVGYSAGVPFVTNSISWPWLRLGSNSMPAYLVLGAAQHGVTYNQGTYPNDRFFAGKMDDVRIYDRTLSASEIGAIYNGQPAAASGSGGAPTLSSATIPPGGTTISLVYSAAVTSGAGGTGGSTISMSGGAVTMTYASGTGTTTLVYNLNRTVNSGETGTTSYTQPGNGWEAVSDATDVASYSGATVTNNSSQGGGGATDTGGKGRQKNPLKIRR